MLRLALTPRWLVALLVLVVFVGTAVVLGRWQWDRTQSILAAERAAASQPIPVQDVFTEADLAAGEVPSEGIGRPVTATGEYEADLQVAVADRLHEGEAGVWIVTGLRLADGSVAAVLRGSLASPDGPGAVAPTGQVTVTGSLQPDEAFYANAVTAPGSVAAIAHDRLAAAWGEPVLPGFVTLVDQDPLDSPAPTRVPAAVQTADVPFPLQNFFYAFQWWIFAAFGVAVYLRWLWLESRRSADTAPAPG